MHHSFKTLTLSPEFLTDNGLDPNLLNDLTKEQWDYIRSEERWDYLRRLRARDAFTMDRGTHADPTMARVLSRVEYTPDSPRFSRPPEVWRSAYLTRYARYASMPVEDLVFTLPCADGAVALSRKAVLLVYTARKLGHIDVTACTTADVVAVVAEGANR